MKSVNDEALDRFFLRVRRAAATGGKSVNLSIEEASELTAAIAQVLLTKLREEPKESKVEDREIILSGGGFRDREV